MLCRPSFRSATGSRHHPAMALLRWLPVAWLCWAGLAGFLPGASTVAAASSPETSVAPVVRAQSLSRREAWASPPAPATATSLAKQPCPLDCGSGGICVPFHDDTGFGTVLREERSSPPQPSNPFVSFRCECFQGHTGTTCQIQEEEEEEAGIAHAGELAAAAAASSEIDGCRCRNGGTCLSIYGGSFHGCLCPKPFWGSFCEMDGTTAPCELECQGPSSAEEPPPRDGAFCLVSPMTEEEGSTEDQTCVHCQELSPDEEPGCEGYCQNGGICRIEYQFEEASVDSSESNDESSTATTTNRRYKCSTTTTVFDDDDDEGTFETVWMDHPPYVLSCDCPTGYQGEFCQEIDRCGGCQNDGYCISEDTPGEDLFGTDDFWEFETTDDSAADDDDYYNTTLYADDDDLYSLDDDFHSLDDFPIDSVPHAGSDCECLSGGCDQTECGVHAICWGGNCHQNHLVEPSCPGGKCSQRHATDPACDGGDCDQTLASGGTCAGTDCFADEPAALASLPPSRETFCFCKYGYFGALCQHPVTAVCLADDALGYGQFLHELCLKSGGFFCPLDAGDRFCTNGGTCGDPDADAFRCECPNGFEGVHCEMVVETEAPSSKPIVTPPIAQPPTVQPPTGSEPTPPVASSATLRKHHAVWVATAAVCAILCLEY